MANTKTEIIGLKEANRALRNLPEYARDEAQRNADVTAFHFSRMAAAKVTRGADPVRPDRTRVADSIGWKSRPRSLSAVVTILKSAFHWKFIEFGTVNHEAHPFLRPTAIQLSPDHQKRMQEGLLRAAAKIAKEGYHGR